MRDVDKRENQAIAEGFSGWCALYRHVYINVVFMLYSWQLSLVRLLTSL